MAGNENKKHEESPKYKKLKKSITLYIMLKKYGIFYTGIGLIITTVAWSILQISMFFTTNESVRQIAFYGGFVFSGLFAAVIIVSIVSETFVKDITNTNYSNKLFDLFLLCRNSENSEYNYTEIVEILRKYMVFILSTRSLKEQPSQDVILAHCIYQAFNNGGYDFRKFAYNNMAGFIELCKFTTTTTANWDNVENWNRSSVDGISQKIKIELGRIYEEITPKPVEIKFMLKKQFIKRIKWTIVVVYLVSLFSPIDNRILNGATLAVLLLDNMMDKEGNIIVKIL